MTQQAPLLTSAVETSCVYTCISWWFIRIHYKDLDIMCKADRDPVGCIYNSDRKLSRSANLGQNIIIRHDTLIYETLDTSNNIDHWPSYDIHLHSNLEIPNSSEYFCE